MPLWRLYYHVIWTTKKRLPMIKPEFESRLHAVIAAKAKDLNILLHAVGGIEDHIHVAISVSPSNHLATVIGQIKGSSAHFVNHNIEVDMPFIWQRGYGILSFDEPGLPRIVRYIKNQREHHNNNTTISRFEESD